MKKVLLSLMVAGLLLASFATLVAAAPGGVTDKDALKDLAAARQSTDKYHDVSVALADGYVPVSLCIEVPGLGVMGIHYANFGLMAPPVDLSTPEVLLYVPTDSGLRLVGVEYYQPYLGPLDEDRPSLFGQPFDGPMNTDHEPVGPPDYIGADHYDLHVWLWQGNPDGIFADFNPNVSCS